MLEGIPNLFKPYFVPNYNEFISLFPNKKDIYNLLIALNNYYNKRADCLGYLYDDKKIPFDDINFIREYIRHVIDNLITIELSFGKDGRLLSEYSNKFMDLLSDTIIWDLFSYFYPKYYRYAEIQIKSRILKR